LSYLLDTNVLSELRQKSPDPFVVEWFSERPAGLLYLSVLTLGGIRKGIEGVTDNLRRQSLIDWLEVDLASFFTGRILVVDEAVADRFSRATVTCH
jgi:predicted nucleic acid-binding protein